MALLLMLSGCSTPATAPAAASSGGADHPPQRIVSLNLCTDQLLMQMVEPGRIAAVTYLARDPAASVLAARARALPVTRGSAEEVIALRPDLVLAGTFSTRQTVALLKRLGYRVVEFEPEGDFTDIIANIRQLAAAVGEVERGEAMVRAIERTLAGLPPAPDPRPVYADYNANGFTSGNGTLVAAVANAAGFETLGQRLGLQGTRPVSLEQMLLARPDVIDLGGRNPAPALATEIQRHPVLQRLLAGRPAMALPAPYTTCGNPQTLRALDAFMAARRELAG